MGDTIAAGACYGKVRAMMDDKGRRVKEAGPSTPVEILGLNDVPNAGEVFVATENEKEARSFAETFISEGKNKLIEDTKAKLSLDDLFSQIKAGNVKELPIIVKADVQGSVEAVKQSLTKAVQRGGSGEGDPRRRGRHQRVRRDPGHLLPTPLSSASTYVRMPRQNPWPSAKKWMCACTRSFTRPSRMWRLP